MNWTKDLPTEDGFYWYWEEEDDAPNVVEFDKDMGWIYFTGNELARGPDLTYKIIGMFYPEKLTPPTLIPEK